MANGTGPNFHQRRIRKRKRTTDNDVVWSSPDRLSGHCIAIAESIASFFSECVVPGALEFATISLHERSETTHLVLICLMKSLIS